MAQQLAGQSFTCFEARLQANEGVHDLAGDRVRVADGPASATAGCSISALSTSNGPIRWPADSMTSSAVR